MKGLTVVTALRLEARAVGRGLETTTDVQICGMRAKRLPALRQAVAVTGIAGGLAPQVRPGDVVVATEVRSEGHSTLCPSAPLLAAALRSRGRTVHLGPLVTTSRIVHDAERDRYGDALAVDLETATVAKSANGRSFAAVRVIVDTRDAPLLRLGTIGRGWHALRQLEAVGGAIEEWARAIGPHDVVIAAPRSFCAGVERAIDIVERALDRFGPPVYVRKQIVHNTHVVADLERRGAVFVDELDDVPDHAVLVFSAHGVAPDVRRRADRQQLQVIDATCPLVAKVHAEARRFANRGQTVLLIGHDGHEEVEGTLGEAPDRIVLVESPEHAKHVQVPDPTRVGYLTQTTLAVDEATQIIDTLRQRFPALEGPNSDDICYATTNRQQAVLAVAQETDVVFVLGSRNSSNSLRLVEVAHRCGTDAYLIEDAAALQPRWLAGKRAVGLTAGASAPPKLVDDVVDVLRGLGPVAVSERAVATEDVRFTVPKEVS